MHRPVVKEIVLKFQSAYKQYVQLKYSKIRSSDNPVQCAFHGGNTNIITGTGIDILHAIKFNVCIERERSRSFYVYVTYVFF